MKIYLATWMGAHEQGVCLTEAKMRTRLVSFYFVKLQKMEKKDIVKYCKTGTYENK